MTQSGIERSINNNNNNNNNNIERYFINWTFISLPIL